MIRKYIDIINETPVAKHGDWSGGGSTHDLTISITTKYIFEHDWTVIDEDVFANFLRVVIAKHNSELTYIAGKILDNGSFERYGLIQIEPCSQTSKKLNIDKLFAVKNIFVANTMRGNNIATTLYKWICENVGPLLSDYEQYHGGRKLWSALSREHDYAVDVVNLNTSEYIETNATLNHGPTDDSFDEKYWSRDLTKEPFRFILRKK